MVCLMCGRSMHNGKMSDALYREDLLCQSCRSLWERYKGKEKVAGYPTEVLWVYNDAYSSTLLQYKECNDEALKDVFLYLDRRRLRNKYRGYTILLMPSTKEKLSIRGFHHLQLMFEGLGLPVLDPFEKIKYEDQTKKTRAQRMEMMRNIRLKEDVVLPRKLLLVDDVWTSGATLMGALQCIDESRHRIRVLVGSRAFVDK